MDCSIKGTVFALLLQEIMRRISFFITFTQRYFLLRLVKLLWNLIAQKQMIFFISVARSTEPVQKKDIKPHRVWFEIGYHYQWLSGEC